jgi:hypothetical protein
VLALGLVASSLVAFGSASAMGGSVQTAIVATAVLVGAIGVGSVSALVAAPMPLFRWGLLVMGAGLARLATLLIAGLQVDFMLSLDRTPFWMALVASGALMLVIESAFLIKAIARMGGLGPGVAGQEGAA